MKKLLLSLLLLAPCLNAKLMYSPEKKMYYSTNMQEEHNASKYHIFAQYAVMLIDNAYDNDINIKDILDHIKNVLIKDGSKEADILYDDIVEAWEN